MTEANWQKSSYSGGTTGNECLEVVARDGEIRLRESDDAPAVITVRPAALAALLHHVKDAGFDDPQSRAAGRG